MAGRKRLYPTGAVVAHEAPTGVVGGASPVVVGSAPQWADGSDATYAEVETYEHPDISYADWGEAELPAQPVIGNAALVRKVYARVRYRSLDANMRPPRIRLYQEFEGSDVQSLIGAQPTTGGSAEITWADIPLEELELGGLQQMLDILNGTSNGTVQMQIFAPFLRVAVGQFKRTRIYEAHVVVQGALSAPPCRITGRGDDLGRGSGRIVPRPKSQQSGRFRGFY